MSQKFIYCKNIGYKQTFRWKKQLKRHKPKCSFPTFLNKSKYTHREDANFPCSSCSKSFQNSQTLVVISKIVKILLRVRKITHVLYVKNLLSMKVFLRDI